MGFRCYLDAVDKGKISLPYWVLHDDTSADKSYNVLEMSTSFASALKELLLKELDNSGR
jgi:hypothetical protein